MTDKQKALQLWQKLLETLQKEDLLNTRGVAEAFQAVPRHLFLPHMPLEEVYANKAIGLKHDLDGLLVSSSSQPSMMAIMLEQMALESGANVLEIGTASGYNAAIMKHIVGDSGSVTTIEIDKDLAEQANKNLQSAKVRDVHVVHGDGAQGYAPRAAYDVIIATVGVWDIPQTWINQLKFKGALVVPVVVDGVQLSACFEPQTDGTLLSADNRPCAFVYLRGNYAGPNFRRQVGSTSLYIHTDEVDKIDTASLHALLSDDYEFSQFDKALSSADYWQGYQLYLMVNEPSDAIFMVYAVIDGQKAYGIEGRGIALFTPGSAAFAGYGDKGAVHCFAGSDAFLMMQTCLDDWVADGEPEASDLRLRLIPKTLGQPKIDYGKLYTRRDNYLHAWIEN
ncbi:MAG: methyltransferase domain-containing protein [Anaerolineae bacterium]|nr:methyltransferase domain-containing protein [Anaerolineae bacterium]MDQ7033593.1 methyltransferase domain-containing protein [Anaerolineae bacterium]